MDSWKQRLSYEIRFDSVVVRKNIYLNCKFANKNKQEQIYWKFFAYFVIILFLFREFAFLVPWIKFNISVDILVERFCHFVWEWCDACNNKITIPNRLHANKKNAKTNEMFKIKFTLPSNSSWRTQELYLSDKMDFSKRRESRFTTSSKSLLWKWHRSGSLSMQFVVSENEV